jgi:hypothetical protein
MNLSRNLLWRSSCEETRGCEGPVEQEQEPRQGFVNGAANEAIRVRRVEVRGILQSRHYT